MILLRINVRCLVFVLVFGEGFQFPLVDNFEGIPDGDGSFLEDSFFKFLDFFQT